MASWLSISCCFAKEWKGELFTRKRKPNTADLRRIIPKEKKKRENQIPTKNEIEENDVFLREHQIVIKFIEVGDLKSCPKKEKRKRFPLIEEP